MLLQRVTISIKFIVDSSSWSYSKAFSENYIILRVFSVLDISNPAERVRTAKSTMQGYAKRLQDHINVILNYKSYLP